MAWVRSMADQVYNFIETSGVIVPDTSEILASVQDEYRSVFGNDLVVTADTPQGVLITAEALARSATANNNAAIANQINPNMAGGVFLDAIMALTGKQRKGATPSIVTAQLTGVAGTVIPLGSQAQTDNGDVFVLQQSVTLGSDGTVSGVFYSAENGPIQINSGTLTQIVNGGVLGWETINNSGTGTTGTLKESDESARISRLNMLAFQGQALAVAITSALHAVPGVQSLWFQENTAATTQTINDISMAPHSIYACVNGGTNLAVATALLENKSSGCGWNGGTTVNVTEPSSGQIYPVKFDRPEEIPFLARVTLAANTAPTNATESVKQAIMDYAAGKVNGEPGFVVGGNVSPFQLSGAINNEFPSIYVRKVELALASTMTWATDEIFILVNQIATIQEVNITVVSA